MVGVVYKPYDELLKAVQAGPLKDSSKLRQEAAAGIDMLEQTIGFGKGLQFVEFKGDAAQGLFTKLWEVGTSTATASPTRGMSSSLTSLPGAAAGGPPPGAAHPIAAAGGGGPAAGGAAPAIGGPVGPG